MAPVINHNYLDHQPVAALVSKEPSRGGLQDMIYMLLLLIGENMSKIQEAYAKNQVDQGVIAQNQAKVTEEQTNKYVSKIQKQLALQAKEGPLGDFLKYLGAALSILIGGLTCGVAGFAMIAVTTAFLVSPIGEKAISSFGDVIAKSLGDSEEAKAWGKIIAQVVVLVAVVVLSAGAEGLETAADDTLTSAAKFTATKMNALQTLGSTGLLGEIVTQLVALAPGDKNKKEMAETVLGIIANFAPMILSIGYALKTAASEAGGGANLIDQLGKFFGSDDTTTLQRYVNYAVAGGGVAVAAGGAADGYYKIELSNDQKALAPLQASLLFGDGFFQILTRLSDLAQKTVQSLMEGDRILFQTDFSADWKACVSAQYQG